MLQALEFCYKCLYYTFDVTNSEHVTITKFSHDMVICYHFISHTHISYNVTLEFCSKGVYTYMRVCVFIGTFLLQGRF